MDKEKSGEKKIDRRKITTPQNSQGGKVSITHGGYSFLLGTGVVPCDKCLFKLDGCKFYKSDGDCEIIRVYREEKTKELMALPWIRSHHIDRVDNYVKLRALAFVIDKWLAKVGIFVKKGHGLDVQPVLKFYFVALNAQERLAEKLGLSPLAENILGIDSKAEETLQDHLNRMQEIKPEDGPEDEKADTQ